MGAKVLTLPPNRFCDGEADMTAAASTDAGHEALLAALHPAADWVSHRSYAREDGTYRVTFTYRP